jgi:hypothetical protein
MKKEYFPGNRPSEVPLIPTLCVGTVLGDCDFKMRIATQRS